MHSQELALDPSVVRSFVLPAELRSGNEVNDFDAFGTDAVYVELNGATAGRGQQVWLVDLAAGQVEPLNDAQPDVSTLAPRISGDDVVWSADEWRPGGSVAWKIMHYSLSTGMTDVVASGRNTALDGDTADAPAVDVDQGVIAYSVGSPSPAHPLASTIVIKRLADGATVRSVSATSTLFNIALSGTNVLFSQGSSDPKTAEVTETDVYLSTDANPEPTLIAPKAFDVSFAADTMVWSGPPSHAPSDTSQAIWTATTEMITPVEISEPPAVGIIDLHPAAGDGFASWNEALPAWSYLVVWDRALGHTVRVMGHGDESYSDNTDFFRSAFGDGWLMWTFVTRSMTNPGTQIFEAVRLDDLRAAYGLPASTAGP